MCPTFLARQQSQLANKSKLAMLSSRGTALGRFGACCLESITTMKLQGSACAAPVCTILQHEMLFASCAALLLRGSD
jgi:hypothetical protein